MQGDAVFDAYQNVGLLSDPTGVGTLGSSQNVGLEIPAITDVFQNQMGWGTPVKPPLTSQVIPVAAVAAFSTYEEVIE